MRLTRTALGLLLLAGCTPPTTAPPDAAVEVDAGSVPLQCGALPAGVAEGSTTVAFTDTLPVSAQRRIVLMGGSAEVDAAMALHVAGAGGGDVLVARASGSVESYLDYLLVEVDASPAPARVSVLRVDDVADAGDDEVLCRVRAADAVWLAGGDQSQYLLAWPPSLQEALSTSADRTIGGTSAGAMVLGAYAFTAREGSVTSSEALNAPRAPAVAVGRSAFAQWELDGVVVDTHFSERDREGRLLTFMARLADDEEDDGVIGVGIDERTALAIDDGQVTVVGDGSAWLYRFSSRSEVTDAPLDGHRAQRLRLSPGTQRPWPVDWATVSTDTLDVVLGTVRLVDGS